MNLGTQTGSVINHHTKMTPTHTPGRLQVPEPYDGQHAVIVENDCGRYAVAASIRNPADARRLAATWNVCANIPTEALERVEGDTTPVFELLMQTTRERDALRTALNNLLNTVNQYDDGDYYLGTDAEQILAEANRVSIETAEPAPPPDTTITTNSVCGKPGTTCGDTIPF